MQKEWSREERKSERVKKERVKNERVKMEKSKKMADRENEQLQKYSTSERGSQIEKERKC